jgi:multiple sugar transport system ATP-binding protein
MAKVTLKHVYKIYPGERGKEVAAVEDFNLEITDREFVVFVGPSGCGKSTTLRMIAGLEEISKGDVLIDDARVNDIPPKDRDIAMVFQNYALYPHMNVYDNMAFGLELRKYPKAEIKKRVLEAAGILGIEQFLNRRPKALFDEPLSNLDAKMRVQMRTEITKLHQRLRATMIYVTHDQIEAMTMGTRIVVMKDGIIQQVDSPLKIYNEPANLFVAGFLGSPPMNLLAGILHARKNGSVLFKEAQGGSIEIELDDRESSAAYIGKEVILGFRPESCDVVSPSATRPENTFQAVVDIVEPMGPETYFHLQTGAHSIVSRSPASAQQSDVGRRLTFRIDAATAHLFDPVTSHRIV